MHYLPFTCRLHNPRGKFMANNNNIHVTIEDIKFNTEGAVLTAVHGRFWTKSPDTTWFLY